MCSESGLPDDPSWGRQGYIKWLDTAQDLFHSKVTHPLDHTDFTTCAFFGRVTHHCTVAGGVGYEKILDWPPWKEPLPRRSWLTAA